jgi:hypothetical protein
MAATKPPSDRENASVKLKAIASIGPHARSSSWRINKGARGTFDLLQFIISDWRFSVSKSGTVF